MRWCSTSGCRDLIGRVVAARMRAGGLSTPILVLSALDQVDDRIAGLRGGRGSITWSSRSRLERVARLRALLRRAAAQARAGAAALQPPCTAGPLLVDVDGAAASWDGRNLGLTGRELALLDALARNAEVVLGRDRLLDMVWGYDCALRRTRAGRVHDLPAPPSSEAVGATAVWSRLCAAWGLCCAGRRSLSSPVRRLAYGFSERPPLCLGAC